MSCSSLLAARGRGGVGGGCCFGNSHAAGTLAGTLRIHGSSQTEPLLVVLGVVGTVASASSATSFLTWQRLQPRASEATNNSTQIATIAAAAIPSEPIIIGGGVSPALSLSSPLNNPECLRAPSGRRREGGFARPIRPGFR